MMADTEDELGDSTLLQQMLEDARAERAGEPKPALAAAQLAEEPKRSFRETVIDEIDALIDSQVQLIFERPEVELLARAWAQLWELVEHLDFDANVQLEILQCSKEELAHDFEAATSVTTSGLYSRLCDAPAPTTGPYAPVGLILAEYEFDRHQHDVEILTNLAAVAADAHAPLLTNAAPSFVDCERFADLSGVDDLRRILESPRYAAWASFRDGEDAPYVGLCMFESARALAARIAETFASSGRFDDLRGDTSLPVDAPGLTLQAEQDLTGAGLITPVGVPRTAYRPRRFADTDEGRAAAMEDAAKVPLSNTLRLCRIAHYLEAIAAEVPEGTDDENLEAFLQSWLDQTVANLPGVDRARLSVTRPSYLRYDLSVDCTSAGASFTQTLAGRLDSLLRGSS